MCEFKSGIIFKNRVELAPLENESHSSLLEKLDIEDNEFNASKKFVRAEDKGKIPAAGKLPGKIGSGKQRAAQYRRILH